jgi:heptosyltransferase-3
MTAEQFSPRAILVIKLRAIGDVLLSTGTLRSLRAAYPGARLDFLLEKPAREVVEGNPDVNSVLVFDPKSESSLSLIRRVRRGRYDMVIDLFGNPRSAILTLLSGARVRVGYRFSWRKYSYNRIVEPRGGEVHNRDFNLDALRAVGIQIGDPSTVFPLSPDGEVFGKTFFHESGLNGHGVVALNPGGGWYTKRWPVRKFALLGDMLAERRQVRIVIIWGPGEKGVAEELKGLMKASATLLPPSNLKELASVLRRCSGLVTNDSGPMHIAASLGTPVVAIFGPTRPDLQGPLGEHRVIVRKETLQCLGCNLTACPIGNPCMEDLEVERVFEACDRLLSHHRMAQKEIHPS